MNLHLDFLSINLLTDFNSLLILVYLLCIFIYVFFIPFQTIILSLYHYLFIIISIFYFITLFICLFISVAFTMRNSGEVDAPFKWTLAPPFSLEPSSGILFYWLICLLIYWFVYLTILCLFIYCYCYCYCHKNTLNTSNKFPSKYLKYHLKFL